MFKLAHPESVLWPVTVERPADKGDTEKHTFYVRFKLIGRKEFDRRTALGENVNDLYREVVVGWEGLDEPFSVEELDRILDLQWVVAPLNQAYAACLNGRRAKN